MKLSTKSRYGLRALFDIAYNCGSLPAQVQDISRRQEISPRYLEQIFQSLKRAGIIKSKRGPQGGYFLARKPDEITVKEILMATEGESWIINCVCDTKKKTKKCNFDGSCVTQTIWLEALNQLYVFFGNMTLQTLCDRGKEMGIKRERDHRFMYFI